MRTGWLEICSLMVSMVLMGVLNGVALNAAIVPQSTGSCRGTRQAAGAFALYGIFPIRSPLLSFSRMACTGPSGHGKGHCFRSTADRCNQVAQHDCTAFSFVDGLYPGRTGWTAETRYRAQVTASPGRRLRAVEEPCAGHDLRKSLHPHPGVLRSRHDPTGWPGHLPIAP